jgi:trk system potassium uptake protein TrkH
MLLSPKRSDYQVIGYYVGRVLIGVGLLMVPPLLIAFVYGESKAAIDLLLGLCLALSLGTVLGFHGPGPREPEWMHGMVVSALSWIVGMMVGAVPSYLSGHYGCYLDACFDLMSGYTTTGLVLIQDLDHVSNALNMWRHLATYAGGQGIVVIALTFLIPGTSGALRMYIGEAKDERLRPNVVATARAIWVISLVYLALGSLVLLVALLCEGVRFRAAWLQAIWLFMSAWSTGGFAPYSQNLLYWHSLPVEVVCVLICVLGSLNFALHFAIWTGRRREAYRNIEVVSFAVTVTATFLVVAAALLRQGIYPDTLVLLRKGFFQLISAHTTTGLQSVYAHQFLGQWYQLATAGLVLAMMFGGSAASTAGGFKGLRVGILFKGLVEDIRRLTVPDSVRIRDHIHHLQDLPLSDRMVRGAALVVVCYVVLFAVSATIGVWCGYGLPQAVFEAASANGNVGLSCGVTAPSMPAVLKVTYLVQMWMARLEFLSVFVLVGFAHAVLFGLRGRRPVRQQLPGGRTAP